MMIIRQLKQSQFEFLHKSLIQKAHAQPLEASFTVDMTVNDVSYADKIQPGSRCRMAVLQAFRIDRDEDGSNFELITRGNLLSAFLEILIYQGIK
jgi:hypothetical protein